MAMTEWLDVRRGDLVKLKRDVVAIVLGAIAGKPKNVFGAVVRGHLAKAFGCAAAVGDGSHLHQVPVLGGHAFL
jgi:hypothetical protein